MTPEQHAVYRAAIAAADSIDPTGCLRAILHILRCADGAHLEDILEAALDGLHLSRKNVRLAMKAVGYTQKRGAEPPGALICPSGTIIHLDEEAAQELELYLTRRHRQSRHILTRYGSRGGKWYLRIVAGGGRVTRCLGTTDRTLAAERLQSKKRGLRELARTRDRGRLFPDKWQPGASMSMCRFRGDLSLAVGRRATSSQLARCAKPVPVWRGGRRGSPRMGNGR